MGVVSVHYVGLRQTYDLGIAGPWHNFVANGLVVHNSFNEFSMRYAKATDDFYVPSPWRRSLAGRGSPGRTLGKSCERLAETRA